MIYKIRSILKVSEWIVATLMGILATVSQAKPEQWNNPFRAHVQFVVDWSIPLLVGIALLSFVLKFTHWVIDGQTANRAEIKNTLEALQRAFFQGVPAEDLYKNRVTLFKVCRDHLRRKSYLKLYARSGTSYQKSKIWFPIDDEKEDRNEGVAGRAYFVNGIVTVVDLPVWPDNSVVNDPTCIQYREKGFISHETANKLDIKSRSIAAIVVRNKSGKRWGVLVLDSRDPQGVSLSGNKKAMMSLIGQVLTAHI